MGLPKRATQAWCALFAVGVLCGLAMCQRALPKSGGAVSNAPPPLGPKTVIAPAVPVAPPVPMGGTPSANGRAPTPTDHGPDDDPDPDEPDNPTQAGPPDAPSTPDASQSVGTAQNGHLNGGVRVNDTGALRVLAWTRQRGFDHGTGALVRLLQRGARTVADAFPGTVVAVGNLSRAGGGDIPPSVSHNSGRDADVPFLAFDRLGGARVPPPFTHFDAAGVADAPPYAAGLFEFDAARNWALVKHWLTDPAVVVQWVFVAVPLRQALLDHALRAGEPELLRRRAARVLVQPRDSSPHADHFHLRIACPADDRPHCVDGGIASGEARAAQVDALLAMYEHGSPAEQRYARELLTLPADGADAELPPIEGSDAADPLEAPSPPVP
ncbi:MAG: hypothetical protein EXR79_05315 [Myxococcales bacterium]|nr:hypothetical protein [Myxococcales bacterium]